MRILWQDESGRERMGRGTVVNVSVSGVCLRMPEKIPVRAALICNEQALGISGRGIVRYCNYVKGQYEIGVEFGGGTGWKEPSGPPPL